MQDVRLPRLDLLERITANRNNHRSIFEQAMEGYRKAAIEELDRAIEDAKAGKHIRRALELIEPQDYTREYDRVIDMLTMSIDETIELTEYDFAQYVRDEWDWKKQFTLSNSRYLDS